MVVTVWLSTKLRWLRRSQLPNKTKSIAWLRLAFLTRLFRLCETRLSKCPVFRTRKYSCKPLLSGKQNNWKLLEKLMTRSRKKPLLTKMRLKIYADNSNKKPDYNRVRWVEQFKRRTLLTNFQPEKSNESREGTT